MSPPERLPPDGPPFAAPWQAQLFSLTVALSEAGHFSWSDWADRFAKARATGAEDASDYYDDWLATLEALMKDLGIASEADIRDLTAAWQRAAAATPHGTPISLDNDPQRA